MNRAAAFLLIACASALVACGGGGGGGGGVTVPPPVGNSNGTIALAVTVPNASQNPAHRAITVPAGTASIVVTVVSVNGTPVTTASSTLNLSGSSCSAGQSATTCTFDITAPTGNDVISVALYSQSNGGGTAIGSGDLSVTVVQNQTVTAPAVLSGTVAKITLALPQVVVPAGNAQTLALTLTAQDTNGNTIIGSYTNPITLSDSDSAGATKLSATTVPDSTTASALALQYLGAVVAQPVTISATASGVATPATATFQTQNDYPLVNGAAFTYGVSVNGAYGGGSVGPTPPAILNMENPYVSSETVTVNTNQSFNGQSGLVSVATQVSATPGVTDESSTDYYQWSQSAKSATLYYVGGETTNGASAFFNQYFRGVTNVVTTCASPYQAAWIVPVPASWDGLAGTGTCTSNATSDNATATIALNADGSYAQSFGGVPIQAQSDGTAAGWFQYSSGTGMPIVTTDYSVYVVMPTPQPMASTIPYTYTSIVGPIPSPGASTPAPVATTAPNWYLAAGAPNGSVPQPLMDTMYTHVGSTTSLPTNCAIPTSVLPAGTTADEVDETHYRADPLGYYEVDRYRYFNVDTIGTVCVLETQQQNAVIYLFLTDNGDIMGYTIEAVYITATPPAAAAAEARIGMLSVLRTQENLQRSRFHALAARRLNR